VKITPQEAAALQSYPADFEFVGTKGSVGLQIGNAVPPLLARAILEELWS
jgi:DNA (cytosine-5)-methyltransferase 1